MRVNYLSLILGWILVGVSPAAWSHDHPAGKIEGTEIQLFERNHGFAGEIKGTPVFGAFSHQPFSSEVTFRDGEETVQYKLEHIGDVYSGLIAEGTQIELVQIQKKNELSGVIHLKLDGTDLAVEITGESFENNHFKKPRFRATVDGKTIEFSFSGQACYGYSINLAMMIFGTYFHLEKGHETAELTF